MDGWAIVAAAGMMGLAGLPHCAAMCAAPCIAVTSGSAAAQPTFQVARVAGYTAAGALAAASVGALREGLAFAPVLRPLWTLLHLAALAFGLWMLATGRWPAWLQRTSGQDAAPQREQGGWQRIALPVRSASAGAAWIAWPCALSQSALLVAALGETPAQGAAAMAMFAVASSPALWLGPWLAQRWRAVGAGGGALAAAAWPVRTAGALLAAGSAWALGHGLWAQVVAWCS
jgi:sulfite exporter TauE/SafE